MSLGTISDYQQSARQMTQQMGKEVHHLRGADGLWVKPEIKVPPRDTGDGREHLPVEMILQHWGLSARGPGAHPMGSLAQPAFIDEDDGAPRALFLRQWPAHSFPVPDRLLVALQRLTPS